MSVQTFMQEYLDSTEPNPFRNKERVWERRACFCLHIWPDVERITLNCIRSLERCKGNGSDALRWLCDLADRHSVMLTGTIQPNGTLRPRLTVKKLRAWYRRNGFVVTAGDWICRIPATELPPQAEERKTSDTAFRHVSSGARREVHY